MQHVLPETSGSITREEQMVEVQGAKAIFSPDLADVKLMLARCVSHIVQAGMELPRVEDVLFPGELT
jgi:hypothetical protein